MKYYNLPRWTNLGWIDSLGDWRKAIAGCALPAIGGDHCESGCDASPSIVGVYPAGPLGIGGYRITRLDIGYPNQGGIESKMGIELAISRNFSHWLWHQREYCSTGSMFVELVIALKFRNMLKSIVHTSLQAIFCSKSHHCLAAKSRDWVPILSSNWVSFCFSPVFLIVFVQHYLGDWLVQN